VVFGCEVAWNDLRSAALRTAIEDLLDKRICEGGRLQVAPPRLSMLEEQEATVDVIE
jgi:hypothetical protein